MKIKNNRKILSNIKIREDLPLLIKHMGYKKICEVGVNAGDFFMYLATTIPDHLVGVDVWDKYDIEAYKSIPSYYLFYPHERNKYLRESIQEWASKQVNNVEIIVDFSVRASIQFEDDYFDFVYLDADHTYKGVTDDLESWYPKVREGGILSGHDYINWDDTSLIARGVDPLNNPYRTKDAIDDFVEKYDKKNDFFITGEDETTGGTKSFLIIK